ncbi:hypothetical protein [Actinoallomurus rhizosphaericola]|uniref:hypothetical protein n=1 Tax=Actinoallomurus rhizosphaericola TaxID=2952536 RepID=UPI0020917E87|nr:hypothetical protein [Actinoallomurus rhizosphaericola]MCO5993022.1 hypothetical protein [Actinoallomurus rhizosphaericola]
MTHALVCPQCAQLDQVQNAQSIYAAQSGVTHSTGVAVGGVIGAGPMAMAVTSHGTQTSHLAMRLAPPPPPRRRSAWNCGVVLIFAISTGIGLIAVSQLSVSGRAEQAGDRWGYLVTSVVGFGLAMAVYVMAFVQGRRLKRGYEAYAAVWPAMMHTWQNAMVCLRCHGAFFPPGVLHSSLGPSRLIPIDAFHAAVTDIGAHMAVAPSVAPDRSIPSAPEGD